MLKNTFKLFFCLALLPTISNQAHAQEDTATAKVLFWGEDALGNRDSVWYIEINTETTTNGIDEHLGEINLYGVPTTKVLDLRIIQRTDTNYLWQLYFDDSLYNIPLWLYNESEIGSQSFTVYSCEQNIDLKTDYRHPLYMEVKQRVVLKIHAENYPIKLYPVCKKYYNQVVATLHDQDGKYKYFKQGYFDYEPTQELCRFDSEDDNYFISIYLSKHWNIEDSISEITIFPNPNDDYIIIEGLENEVVQLYDAVGSFIYSFTISASPYNLNISDLPVGAYYLKNNDKQVLGKFIKEGK